MCVGSHSAAAAEKILREWTNSESLIKHGLAVARCTESYGRREAARMGLEGAAAEQFADRYRAAGLLHDMDYERHPSPDEHPTVGVAHLRAEGWPEGHSARDSGPCGLHGRSAGKPSGPCPVCLGRAGRLSDRMCAG